MAPWQIYTVSDDAPSNRVVGFIVARVSKGGAVTELANSLFRSRKDALDKLADLRDQDLGLLVEAALSLVTEARIIPSKGFGSKAVVEVRYGTLEWVRLFDFFDDELKFHASEFVGKTEDQARALFGKKDLAYIQS